MLILVSDVCQAVEPALATERHYAVLYLPQEGQVAETRLVDPGGCDSLHLPNEPGDGDSERDGQNHVHVILCAVQRKGSSAQAYSLASREAVDDQFRAGGQQRSTMLD